MKRLLALVCALALLVATHVGPARAVGGVGPLLMGTGSSGPTPPGGYTLWADPSYKFAPSPAPLTAGTWTTHDSNAWPLREGYHSFITQSGYQCESSHDTSCLDLTSGSLAGRTVSLWNQTVPGVLIVWAPAVELLTSSVLTSATAWTVAEVFRYDGNETDCLYGSANQPELLGSFVGSHAGFSMGVCVNPADTTAIGLAGYVSSGNTATTYGAHGSAALPHYGIVWADTVGSTTTIHAQIDNNAPASTVVGGTPDVFMSQPVTIGCGEACADYYFTGLTGDSFIYPTSSPTIVSGLQKYFGTKYGLAH